MPYAIRPIGVDDLRDIAQGSLSPEPGTWEGPWSILAEEIPIGKITMLCAFGCTALDGSETALGYAAMRTDDVPDPDGPVRQGKSGQPLTLGDRTATALKEMIRESRDTMATDLRERIGPTALEEGLVGQPAAVNLAGIRVAIEAQGKGVGRELTIKRVRRALFQVAGGRPIPVYMRVLSTNVPELALSTGMGFRDLHLPEAVRT